MALFVPRAFGVDDRGILDRLIDEHPFATLITPAAPEPYVSHVPLLREVSTAGPSQGANSAPSGGAAGLREGALLGHFARANPHAQHADGAVSIAIFHGPHAYVSPTWYEEPENAVPTWNLATVHVHGTIACLPAAADAERVVATLVEQFEGAEPGAWRFAMTGKAREAMIGNIVAFRLSIARVTGKFKLSQNRPPADRRRVIAALAQSAHADARATAAWMQLRESG